ncbi:hypothetical protein D3C77_386870 [compost metagenome]
MRLVAVLRYDQIVIRFRKHHVRVEAICVAILLWALVIVWRKIRNRRKRYFRIRNAAVISIPLCIRIIQCNFGSVNFLASDGISCRFIINRTVRVDQFLGNIQLSVSFHVQLRHFEEQFLAGLSFIANFHGVLLLA